FRTHCGRIAAPEGFNRTTRAEFHRSPYRREAQRVALAEKHVAVRTWEGRRPRPVPHRGLRECRAASACTGDARTLPCAGHRPARALRRSGTASAQAGRGARTTRRIVAGTRVRPLVG